MPKSDVRAERIISRVQAAVPYLARVVAGIGGVRADDEVAPYLDLLERAMAELQITEEEAEALRITAEQWGLKREQVMGAHHEFLRALW